MTVFEIGIAAALGVWLVAALLVVLRLPAFKGMRFRLMGLRLGNTWRMFESPRDYFHTIEYRDDRQRPPWVVVRSTLHANDVPLVMTPAALYIAHVHFVVRRLEQEFRKGDAADPANLQALEANLRRDPAIRAVSREQRPVLRVMRRHPGRPAQDAPIWTSSPGAA